MKQIKKEKNSKIPELEIKQENSDDNKFTTEQSSLSSYHIPKKKPRLESKEIEEKEENCNTVKIEVSTVSEEEINRSTESNSIQTDDSEYIKTFEKAYVATLTAQEKKCIQIPVSNIELLNEAKKESPNVIISGENMLKIQSQLTSMMKPLTCDLCNAKMNTTMQSKIHYSGKPHMRKVKVFFKEKLDEEKTENSSTDDTNITISSDPKHCEICNVWFTSLVHAKSHYDGKKHKRAAHGIAFKKKKHVPTTSINEEDPTGRFGIGEEFLPKDNCDNPDTASDSKNPIESKPGTYNCIQCNVSVNTENQLQIHILGSKHKKMLRKLGLTSNESETSNTPNGEDYSKFRLPSGMYYCTPCKANLESDISFAQHMATKKHKRAVYSF